MPTWSHGRLRAIDTPLGEFPKSVQPIGIADHHHDNRVAAWCAAPPGAQDVLVGAEPQRYFVPPYVGYRGWVGVYLDVEVDWDAVALIVEDAYRSVLPKRSLGPARQGRDEARP